MIRGTLFLFFGYLVSNLSQCAARRTRHRAFSSRTLQLSILIFHVLSNPTKTSPETIRNRLEIGSAAVPGALEGDLGTILVPGWPKA